MTIQLGFSPCPNDTFIFDALVNRLIDTGSYDFKVHLEDVETLNQWAIAGRLDVTKLSYAALPPALKYYQVLQHGSALGRGVGPLLIRKAELEQPVEAYDVAIPGEHTTAHLLFSLAYPKATRKVFLRYDDIESFVQEGKGLGVIIHENRFTYLDRGLHLVRDLGAFWESETGAPIPLGGIAAKRSLPMPVRKDIDRLIGESIAYAYTKYPELSDYIRCHAQEMSEDVMRKHINLYVNEFSSGLGDEGRRAVMTMLDVYSRVSGEPVMQLDEVFV